jgi:hypothetical protein
MANEDAQEASGRIVKPSLESLVDNVPTAAKDDVGHTGERRELRGKFTARSSTIMASVLNELMLMS